MRVNRVASSAGVIWGKAKAMACGGVIASPSRRLDDGRGVAIHRPDGPVAQLIRALIAQGVSAELIEKASQGIVAKR